jgi:tetrahydromethanopterin S-methyltransferase subunit B
MNIKYITQFIPKPILAVLVFGYMIGLYVVCPLVTIVVAIKWLLKF